MRLTIATDHICVTVPNSAHWLNGFRELAVRSSTA